MRVVNCVFLVVLAFGCTPNIYQFESLKTALIPQTQHLESRRLYIDKLERVHRALERERQHVLFVSATALKDMIEARLPIRLRGYDLNREYLKGRFRIDAVDGFQLDENGHIVIRLVFSAQGVLVDLSPIPMAGQVAEARLTEALEGGGVISVKIAPQMHPKGTHLTLQGRCIGLRLNRHNDRIYTRHIMTAIDRTFFSTPWRLRVPKSLVQENMSFAALSLGWFWTL